MAKKKGSIKKDTWWNIGSIFYGFLATINIFSAVFLFSILDRRDSFSALEGYSGIIFLGLILSILTAVLMWKKDKLGIYLGAFYYILLDGSLKIFDKDPNILAILLVGVHAYVLYQMYINART